MSYDLVKPCKFEKTEVITAQTRQNSDNYLLKIIKPLHKFTSIFTTLNNFTNIFKNNC